jgi:pimeloyl-ACP methyl ester carboxylesterase
LAAAGDLAAAKAYWLQTEWFAPAMQQTAVQTQLQQMVADYSGWHFTHANPVIGVRPRANERLTEITAPTLVVVGELDLPFYNLPIAARLAEQIPGARQVTLPGVGHMVNMEDVAAFNAALADFLAP